MKTIKVNFLTLALSILFIAFFSSCGKDASLIDVDSFTDDAMIEMRGGVIGKSGCYELIFPVTIEFDDETTAEVVDFEDMFATVTAWYTDNEVEPKRSNKPSLVFPVQIVNEDAEIIDVESKSELHDLKKECFKENRGHKCKGGKGHACFTLVFPLSVEIGGEVSTFEDKSSLREAIKAYKEDAGMGAERPELVFPITIEYEDGTQVEVADIDELKALKEACEDEEN